MEIVTPAPLSFLHMMRLTFVVPSIPITEVLAVLGNAPIKIQLYPLGVVGL